MLEYLLNHRRQKSLRRSLFDSYRRSLEVLGFYDPMADYVFSRAIRNTDHLRKLLEMDPSLKSEIFQDVAPYEAFELFNWLATHYDESMQSRLFLSLQNRSRNRRYLRDTLRMLRVPGMASLVREHFRRVPANWKRLHDALVSLHRLHRFSTRGKKSFLYRKQDRQAEGTWEGLSYRLPEGIEELHHWAKELGNCLFSYGTTIQKGESIVFGIFKEGNLAYAIEIRRMEIVQARARFNRKIPPADMEKIGIWFKRVYQSGWLNMDIH
jgi:hypothetical protein